MFSADIEFVLLYGPLMHKFNRKLDLADIVYLHAYIRTYINNSKTTLTTQRTPLQLEDGITALAVFTKDYVFRNFPKHSEIFGNFRISVARLYNFDMWFRSGNVILGNFCP